MNQTDTAIRATPVGGDEIIFDFERDFAGELKCMPMITRLKLDRCGVKLSLKQWNRLNLEERRELVALPCDTIEEIDAYGEAVAGWIMSAGDTPSRFQIDLDPAWERETGTPPQVSEFAVGAGVRVPRDDEWRRLTPLQRFVLIKLTRPGHTNANLASALQEFGLPV